MNKSSQNFIDSLTNFCKENGIEAPSSMQRRVLVARGFTVIECAPSLSIEERNQWLTDRGIDCTKPMNRIRDSVIGVDVFIQRRDGLIQ
jgi:hypothetical protein